MDEFSRRFWPTFFGAFAGIVLGSTYFIIVVEVLLR